MGNHWKFQTNTKSFLSAFCRSGLRPFALAVGLSVILLLAGCASEPEGMSLSGRAVVLPSKKDISVGVPRTSAHCTPVMIWSMGARLDGGTLTSQGLRDGDIACSVGDRSTAERFYNQVAREPFQSVADTREVAIRRAAVALGRRAFADALTILNDYVALAQHRAAPGAKSLAESDPFTPEIGYLLGASYAGMLDVEQALAWWSRVYVAGRGNSALAMRSKDGVFRLLRRADEETRARVRELWRDDTMVRTELARAQAAGFVSGGSDPFEVVIDEGFTTAGTAGRIDDEESSRDSLLVAGASAAQGDAIGILLPLSGRFAVLGERAKRGAELAVGVLDRPASVLVVDSTETPEGALARMNELMRGGVVSIVGPLLAEQVDGVAAAMPDDVYVFSLSRRSPERTRLEINGLVAGNQRFVNLGITSVAQVNSILGHARQSLGITQIAVVGTDEGVRSASDAIRSTTQALGMVVVLERTFGREDIGAATAAGRDLSQSSAQAVLFVDGPAVAANVMAGVAEEQRRFIKVLGLAAFDNENQLRQAGLVLHGARFVSGFVRNSQRPAVRDFVAVYQERFRELPDVVAAQGFDAASLALYVREQHRARAGSLGMLPPYEGLTGRIEISSTGEVVRQLSLAEFQARGITEIL